MESIRSEMARASDRAPATRTSLRSPSTNPKYRSVTKSVVSILTGIALEQGYITSLDQTLADYLTPLADSVPPDKGRITLRDVLKMSSGLYPVDNENLEYTTGSVRTPMFWRTVGSMVTVPGAAASTASS